MNSSRLTVCVLVALLATLVALVCVPASVAKATQVTFVAPPATVFQGQRTTLKAVVSPADASCKLTIKYKGGRLQRVQQKSAVGGLVSWTVRIPAVRAGTATATIACAPDGVARASLDVQWALQAPKVTIARSGFSQRPQKYGGGSDVNYGLEVHNERARFDATNVTLLVNIVDDTNRVLGTGFVRLQRLPASSVFYVGGQRRFPLRRGFADRGRRQRVFRPEGRRDARADQRSDHRPVVIRAIIRRFGAGTGAEPKPSANGFRRRRCRHPGRERQHHRRRLRLRQGPLSLGAREAFSVGGPFSAIPIANAAQAIVSIIPNYRLTP